MGRAQVRELGIMETKVQEDWGGMNLENGGGGGEGAGGGQGDRGPAARLQFQSAPEGLSFPSGASCLPLRRLRQG